MRQKVFAAAGYATVFMGTGRPEFNPKKEHRPFEEYLQETAQGTMEQMENREFDEGVIGSFMSSRFINQANLPGFLPFMVPSLMHKMGVAVEGACGTGGRAIGMGVRGVLSGISNASFICGFEMQNVVKAVYGADILAGAAYYKKERKEGQAYFFPGIFDERASAYFKAYDSELARKGMAKWYENSIQNARKNPKAQEYYNKTEDLYKRALMTPPAPDRFLPHLNYFDCSKVSDGAASMAILSEKGLKESGVKHAVEIVALGEAEGDITNKPKDPTYLQTTKAAVEKALAEAGISLDDLAVLEIHDCFTITALLALETLGFAPRGKGAEFVLEGNTEILGKIPTNLSGGLGGYGHPTGATGVRQMVDLIQQLTGQAPNQVKLKSPYGMMISMGGNDVTVSAIIVKASR